MTAPHSEQLIDGYLARLSDAAAGLPKGPRSELIDDMRRHIAEARARESEQETDATILNILDRLGEPATVVADAYERLGIRPRVRFQPGILEFGAMFLLPFIWPYGVILLFSSRAWRTRDKVIASLVPPGGYFGLLFFALTAHAAHLVPNGSGGFPEAMAHLSPLLFIVVLFFSPTYLFVRMGSGQRRVTTQREFVA